MTREEKVNLLNELLEIEEKNDIGNLTSTDRREFQQWVEDLEQEPKIGRWIEDAKTYYEELNKRGLGVDEYTPYFTDDIACSECLAKYSMLDNETQFFKYCPNCGARMESEEV